MGLPVTCQVCGEEIGDDAPVETCPACDTVHHRDCWLFNEGCSIYGCSRAPGTRPRPLPHPGRTGRAADPPGQRGGVVFVDRRSAPPDFPQGVSRALVASYRDAPVIEIQPAPSPARALADAGHLVLAVLAFILLLAATSLPGIYVPLLCGCSVIWSLLGLWSRRIPEPRRRSYHRCLLGERHPTAICRAQDVQRVTVIERVASGDHEYAVSLEMRDGDRVLVTDFSSDRSAVRDRAAAIEGQIGEAS